MDLNEHNRQTIPERRKNLPKKRVATQQTDESIAADAEQYRWKKLEATEKKEVWGLSRAEQTADRTASDEADRPQSAERATGEGGKECRSDQTDAKREASEGDASRRRADSRRVASLTSEPDEATARRNVVAVIRVAHAYSFLGGARQLLRVINAELARQQRVAASQTNLARGRKSINGVWRNPRGAVV